MSPFQITLSIIVELSKRPRTTHDLQAEFAISRATLKRHIDEARHLGAQIEARRRGPGSEYILTNADEVAKTARGWLSLEQTRDLRQ